MATDKELQSKVIDFLRFPLIVGVIFIHNYGSTANIPEMASITGHTPVYHICSELFSHILGSVAVPLFFFISGFLFFRNTGFDKQCYVKKLNNRAKSLLVPYLFWNISTLIFFFTITDTPLLNVFSGTSPKFSLQYISGALFQSREMLAYQFWFVRNLIVVVILSPVIYLYVKKFDIYGILLLGVLWFFWEEGFGKTSIQTIFFPVGAWFGMNGRDLVKDTVKFKSLSSVLYPLMVVADLLTKGHSGYLYIHNARVIIGLLFAFNIGLSSVWTTVPMRRKSPERAKDFSPTCSVAECGV
ncbi:glucans biosynthesis protein [Bacteroidales bacterium Barb7]|nr:glucans biosynthesis protein [Bacteroidales bacterium Barb7]